MANATPRKPSIVVASFTEDGSLKLKNKSYERVIDEAGMEQLQKNLKLVASESGNEVFKTDVDGDSLFIIVKAGKSFSPNVAYGAVAPWETRPEAVLYEGVESVKNRYEVNMKRSFKAIDLITKDVEASTKKASITKTKVIEEALKTMTPAEQEIAKKFQSILAAMEKSRKALKKAEKAETPAPELEGIEAERKSYPSQ